MKIIHIMPSFHPTAGGGFSAVYHLARAQHNLGHEVYVFSFRGSHGNTHVLSDDFEVLYYEPIYYIKSTGFSPHMIRDVFRMCPDIVHLHGMICREQALVLCLLARLRRRRPVILWTVHGIHEHYEIALRSGVGCALLIFPLIVAMNLADRIIALSPMDLKLLSRLGIQKQKTVVIPNGVDWTSYAKLPTTDDLLSIRQYYNLEKNVVILTICVIRPNKGLEYLIQVANSLKDAKFVIVGSVGDKKYYTRLKKLAEGLKAKNVIFLGWLSEEHKRLLLFTSDIFVLPSLSETLPLVLLEAMAAGKPIVASQVGGIPYLVKDEVNGLLVKPGDPKALAMAIKRLIADQGLRHKMGRVNRRIIKEQYSWDSIAKKTLLLGKQILATRAGLKNHESVSKKFSN